MEVKKIGKIKKKELERLIRHCEEKGYSLDKTLEFLDAVGTYDRMFVYRTFKDSNDGETSNESENIEKPYSPLKEFVVEKKKNKKPKIVSVIILTVMVVVLIFGLNNYLTYKHDREVQEKTQHNANMFLLSIVNAISNLEKGMYEIKEGFDEYKAGNYTHTSLDIVMMPYLSKAEWYWDMAETDLSEAFESMSTLKKLVDDKTYDHFVDMYASVSEYREGVSPYGKSSIQYNDDVSNVNSKLQNAIARFKSYIHPILNAE